MTFMEVKGQQKPNIVNNDLWIPNLQETLMQAKDGGDLHRGQRSSEVKRGKQCALATIFDQRNR